jgi:hypothetical protein
LQHLIEAVLFLFLTFFLIFYSMLDVFSS